MREPDGAFETQALLCTDQTVTSLDILTWFVRRWRMEITDEESRAHLGSGTRASVE